MKITMRMPSHNMDPDMSYRLRPYYLILKGGHDLCTSYGLMYSADIISHHHPVFKVKIKVREPYSNLTFSKTFISNVNEQLVFVHRFNTSLHDTLKMALPNKQAFEYLAYPIAIFREPEGQQAAGRNDHIK